MYLHVLTPREKAAGVNSSDLRYMVAEHTGHSSQLFPVTAGRNDQFLATIDFRVNVSHTDTGS